jgi:hypothetical protein
MKPTTIEAVPLGRFALLLVTEDEIDGRCRTPTTRST